MSEHDLDLSDHRNFNNDFNRGWACPNCEHENSEECWEDPVNTAGVECDECGAAYQLDIEFQTTSMTLKTEE